MSKLAHMARCPFPEHKALRVDDDDHRVKEVERLAHSTDEARAARLRRVLIRGRELLSRLDAKARPVSHDTEEGMTP